MPSEIDLNPSAAPMPGNPSAPGGPIAPRTRVPGEGETILRAPSVWDRLFRNSRSLTAIAILFFIMLLALAAGTLSPYDYKTQMRGSELVAPSFSHFSGRICWGATSWLA